MNKTLATSFALTVAAAVTSGCGGSSAAGEGADTAESSAKIKCMGINECKGQGACDTATHSCAGQNECKGKGWILATETECKTKGGDVI